MGHSAKILADSVSPAGVRLTTFEITFPRIILSELNTHKMLSKNSASSRAIPVKKMIKMVEENPYVPSSWGKNQKGMQAGEAVADPHSAEQAWLAARDFAVAGAQRLLDIGVHKQLTNRLLEPFMWHTAIISGTEWSNFFHLRDNEMAHPDIQKVAHLMRELHESKEPSELGAGLWHLPLIDSADWDIAGPFPNIEKMIKISVARCARVSYLTHDGKRDHEADIELYDRLLSGGHMSPFEHVARTPNEDYVAGGLMAADGTGGDEVWYGNFRGWVQYRKTIPHEADILGAR